MTTVYFIRHAEPNIENHDDMTRELTAKGMEDRKLVTQFLSDKGIDIVLSSPYKRAVDTVRGFADANGLEIRTVYDFRERKVDSGWIEDIDAFFQAQWRDFDYRRSDGESLRDVQKRNIMALRDVLAQYKGKSIAVGSHGTALSTIINYYDRSFGYSNFKKIRNLMPWVVKFTFENDTCIEIQQYNLFAL